MFTTSKIDLLIYLISLTLIIFCTGCDTNNSDTNNNQSVKENVDHAKDESLAGNVENGKSLFATCIVCHGDKGQGLKALNAPALTNQNAWYLERQLANFKSGIRGNDPEDMNSFQMAAIAKTLNNNQAIKDVVAYTKTLPGTSTEKTIEGDVEKGKNYYNMICGACHGPGAKGNESLNSPKLTGINDWYLLTQFQNFKEGKRGSHANDQYGAQMKDMATSLPDDQSVKDVVAYIQSLQSE